MSKVVQCPECGGELAFFDVPVTGQHFRCGRCDADLEIVDSKTMELDWAYKPPVVRDDWQDLNVFLGANRMEDVDWDDSHDLDKVNEWDDDIADESLTRDTVR